MSEINKWYKKKQYKNGGESRGVVIMKKLKGVMYVKSK
jgi:hypothetical protein